MYYRKFHIRKYFLQYTFVLAALFLCKISYPQYVTIPYRFQHYTTEDGLSRNLVESIFQDSKGFMWFCTQDGLNRFDGYRFMVFKPDKKNPYSIGDNFIFDIQEDTKGDLWLATRNGLDKYLYQKNKFIHFQNNKNDKNSIPDNFINCLRVESDKKIWIGTENKGLCLLDFSANETKPKITVFNTENSGISSNKILCIYKDSKDLLWIGTFNGLNCYDRKNGKIVRFNNLVDENNRLLSEEIKVVFEDSRKNIWVGTSLGINRFNPKTNRTVAGDLSNIIKSTKSYVIVYGIIEDKLGNILFSTEKNGLFLYNYQNNSFSVFPYGNDNYSLTSPEMKGLFSDKEGIVWVGTNNGLNKFNVYQKKFNNITQYPDGHGLSSPIVNAITEDENYIWIGTSGGGLNYMDKKTGKISCFRSNKNNPAGLPIDAVCFLLYDPAIGLWVGTWGGGLCKLVDKEKGIFKKYLTDKNNSNSIHDDRIPGLCYDKKRNWLFIADMLGVDVIDMNTEKVYRIDGKSIKGNPIPSAGALLVDHSEKLWIGAPIALYCIDLTKYKTAEDLAKNAVIYEYTADRNNPKSLSGNYIIAIYEDVANKLWCTAVGGGLNKLDYLSKDMQTAEFSHVSSSDGLSNNVIYRILEDKNKNLWLSTDNGLCCYNYENKTLRNYFVNDGLRTNQFFWCAAHHGKDGTLYFGSLDGMTYFQPDSIKALKMLPQIALVDFKLYNISVSVSDDSPILKQSIVTTKEITLTYKEKIFTFDFAALSYNNPKSNKYAYMLENFESNWNNAEADHRFATYTNLDAGTYFFKVKASNSDGVWNEDGISIKVIVLPPWWETWWFRTIGILIFWGIITTLYIMRVTVLKRQKKILEQKVHERTLVLEQANVDLKSQKEEIIQQNEEIRQQSEELLAQSEVLARQNDKLIELDKFKETITGTIVHDLKNPLNSIIVLSELMFPFEENPENAMNLKIMNQSGKQMLQMVMNILDVQKFESAKMKVDMQKIQLFETVQSSMNQVPLLLEQKNIQTNIVISEAITILGDSGLLVRVFTNLLTNAIKFTPKGGNIYIEASVASPARTVIISFKDTGCGIREDKLPTIFEKFNQAEARDLGQTKSTGLGLAFCKMAVEAHGGKIWVESEVGVGTIFYVSFFNADN